MLRSSSPWLALVVLALPAVARANDFSLKLEPGVAVPLDAPQTRVFQTGGGQSFKALFGITPYLDIGPDVSFLFLPSSTEGGESGTAWGLGGGLRLKRPHDADSAYGISPWIDLGAMYVRTGDLNRPGFDIGAGLAIPFDDERRYWAGPFVRYQQTLASDGVGHDSTDAKILLVGVSLEVGTPGHKHPPITEVRYTEVAPVAAVAPVAPITSCADRDQDGVPDTVDHCPDVAGFMENFGCPNYKKVVVKKDKLELKEKLYFAWDKATLEDASFPVLDDVVQALKDSPGFRVQVEGHTDSSGADDHNQTLSEQRAAAVLDYLAAHGIAKDRLVSKGFASSVPIDTNTTVAGRENNRRVEFVVSFIILNTTGAK